MLAIFYNSSYRYPKGTQLRLQFCFFGIVNFLVGGHNGSIGDKSTLTPQLTLSDVPILVHSLGCCSNLLGRHVFIPALSYY